MFTKEEIDEIKKKLNLMGVKDTQFSKAEALTGNETIAFVQNKKNVQLPLKELMEQYPQVYADEEDITQENKKLKFKDRQYDSTSYGAGSKGYVILRKGDTKTSWGHTLPENAFTTENTIYEIRYPFDLQGIAYILPRNCTLFFNGGTLNNGGILGNNTAIANIEGTLLANTSLRLTGTYRKGTVLYKAEKNKIQWYNGTDWIDFSTDASITDISAQVINVEDSDTADANVSVVDNVFKFSFKLKQGEKGEKGDPGDVSISSRTFFIYKASVDTPDTPTGGSWDSSTDTFIPPEGWSTSNTSGIVVWMSSGVFYSNSTSIVGNWTTPVKVTSTDGKDGKDGLNIKVLYAVTTVGSSPTINKENINPGSQWSAVVPSYDIKTQILWSTAAYITSANTLATIEQGAPYYGWSEPWVTSGISGEDGVVPNYKVFIFCNSASLPNKPTSNDPNNPGTSKNTTGGTVTWLDAPTSVDGTWWMSVGEVDGITGLISTDTDGNLKWSTAKKVTGTDGEAQDGKRVEFRFNMTLHSNGIPSIAIYSRDPSVGSTIWQTNTNFLVAEVPSGDYYVTWMTFATINPDDTLSGTWEYPIQISGEQGPKGNDGPAGPQGISGIPGTDFIVRYCLGTESTFNGNSSPSGENPEGWSEAIPTLTDEYKYIWCIQGKITYNRTITNGIPFETQTISWSSPFRLSGLNGLNGTTGKKGQIVYPAGIYNVNTSYVTNELSAPYVLDTLDGNYYVLNAQMTWLGTEQSGITPSEEYAINKGKYWLKFDAFNTVFTKVGIIANGLIGSAVFNGDYMFSQIGIDINGNPSNKYQQFNANSPYSSTNSFRPNICINLKTGEAWFVHGLVHFSDNEMSFITSSGSKETLTSLQSLVTQNADKIESVVSKQEKVGVEYPTSRWVGNDGFSYFNFKNGGGYYVVYSKDPQAYYDSCRLLTIDNVSAGDKIHIEGNNMYVHIIGCDGDYQGAESDFSQEYPSEVGNYNVLGFGGDQYSEDVVSIVDWVSTSNWAKVYIMLSDDNPSAYQTAKTTLIKSAYTAESRIKQTADRIEAKVGDVGIDINNKTITLSATNTIVKGDLSVQRVNCYYPDGSIMSSFNGSNNGTIIYYYPNGNKLREDSFIYDDSGNVTGMMTIYYNANGSVAWKLTSGGFEETLSDYWTYIYNQVYASSSIELKNYIKTYGKNLSNVPSSAITDFSVFHSISSSTYNNRIVKGKKSTSTLPPLKGSGYFTGAYCAPQPMQSPSLDGSELYYYHIYVVNEGVVTSEEDVTVS